MPLPSIEEVRCKKGLTRRLAAEWGVPYPLSAGWKSRLIERLIADDPRQPKFTARGLERLAWYKTQIKEREQMAQDAQALLTSAHAELATFLESGEDRA